MNLLAHAYYEIYPEDITAKTFILNYSGRFKGYNANIRMKKHEVTLNASKQWRGVSKEIQKGLCQELIVRLFKTKTQTMNMELYHHFIRNLPKIAPKTNTHPILEPSFERINNHFFNGMLDQPNLIIGNGVNRLGTYEYQTDTVSISKILLDNQTLLDYVMYHELLHKKHQYKAKKGRQLHHSKKFKQDEAKFPNAQLLEKELEKLVRKNKRKFSLFW